MNKSNPLDEVYEDVDFEDIFGEGNEEAEKPKRKKSEKTKDETGKPAKKSDRPAKKSDRVSIKKDYDLTKDEAKIIDNSSLVKDEDEDFVNEDNPSKNEKYFNGTSKVSKELILEMERKEEIEAEIIRKNKGRYIEAVDNVKPSKTLNGEEFIKSANPQGYSLGMFVNQQYDNLNPNNNNDDLQPSPSQAPQIVNAKIRADGITLSATGVLDPGEGSQEAHHTPQELATEPSETNGDEDIIKPFDDPDSYLYRACLNSTCAYRENCLRYRLSPHKTNKNLFYPESCRIDGVYQAVEGSGITGLVPFHVLESKSTPSL